MLVVGILFLFATAWSEVSNYNSFGDFGKFEEWVDKMVGVADSPDVDLPYPIEDSHDPANNGKGVVDLDDPSNVKRETTYDPETGTFEFGKKMGDIDFRKPSTMTEEEYRQYQLEQALMKYWQDKVAEDNKADEPVGPIPTLELGKGKVTDWLGGKIEIRPQGSIELKFGVNSNKVDNPQIPEGQRRMTTFNFDQNIQLNLIGSIGDRMKINMNYNTQATFDFQNQFKIHYRGTEDEIIQKIEAGNVSLPLNGSLISGSQSLFGIKSELKFGRLTVTSVASQQRGERKELEISGGARKTEFELYADNYEVNRHYYLNRYFRDTYDQSMSTLPLITSGIQITRIEVWITNRRNQVTDTRNIIGFTDLGESKDFQLPALNDGKGLVSPDNNVNSLYGDLKSDNAVRSFVNATNKLASYPKGALSQSEHFEKVENARMLTTQEYTYNAVLGYISLNQSLNNDEVLAVAYEYTKNGETYQVGEFSTDGVAGQDALYLKLLKGTITNPRNQLWDLMMKNIYSIGAYQIDPSNFRMDVWYNNPLTSVDLNYIPKAGVDKKPIVQVIGMDRLNQQQASVPDGVIDFVQVQKNGNKETGGATINPQNGRVIFTTAEPFGSTLDQALANAGISEAERKAIVYQSLYDSTKTAAQQIPALNRFKMKGTYQSSVASDISLNALNIPKGSVKVSAGGATLVEGQDYTVDYNLGRVKIINESVMQSGTPIKVSLESNSLFNIQTKTLLGTHLDYKVNKDFNVGATVLGLTERPLTQKVNIGDEPIRNTMLGLNTNYKTDVPFLTKMVDKIPFINTKEMSSVTFQGEYAHLIPGHSRAIGSNGNAYIDDFEGSQSAIDIRSFNNWVMASVPQGQPDLFPEGGLYDDISAGYNRSKMAWYVIDQTVFFRNNSTTPDNIKGNTEIQHNHFMREVLEQEVFPNKQLSTGQPSNIPVFDVAYYPRERGPYNLDTSGINPTTGEFTDPEEKWGGIMRQLTTNDFETSNIEFIQFWVMDPFSKTVVNGSNEDSKNTDGGDLYFNLGNISEDILRDGRKAYENGLPTSASYDANDFYESNWARNPTAQQIVNAFDNNLDSRIYQDVGLDGWDDNGEKNKFASYYSWAQSYFSGSPVKDKFVNDPTGDNYHFYRGDDYDAQNLDVLERYKNYNGLDGNSPTTEMAATMNTDGYPTAATTIPNVEDINQDNNLSESESYFQYKVSLRPQDMEVGKNYITDRIMATHSESDKQVYWYQFKIPVRSPDKVINNIPDFRSIRFIRMFMKGFSQRVVLRFARLELIRGEWRRYQDDLLADGEYIQGEESQTTFNVGAVNLEENGNREPIDYVIPPGIQQELNAASANQAGLNEQSLVVDVCGLTDGDARATYRTLDLDVRSYKKLRMFIHAEDKDLSKPAGDDHVTAFIRLGTDFDRNYYEYEIPLKLSAWGSSRAEDIWPEANNMIINFSTLLKVKQNRNSAKASVLLPFSLRDPENSSRKITVVGNPNLQGVKTIMLGVRNPKHDDPNNYWIPDDGQEKCVEVWFNELRLTDFDEFGGWAAQGSVNAQLADFANVNLSGNISTPGFGSIEKKVSERQRETRKGYDASSTIQLGKFFGESIGVNLPMYVGQSEAIITPQFDPQQPDQPINDLPTAEQNQAKNIGEDVTKRRSINFANVSIKPKSKDGKRSRPMPWSVSNVSFSYAYNESSRRSFNIESDFRKNYQMGLNYGYNPNPKPIKPLAKIGFLRKSKWLRIIRDFNFYLQPKNVSFTTNLNRSYNEYRIRTLEGQLVIPQFTKTFTWDRNYSVKYDITKGLKFNFKALNNAFIDEPSNVEINQGIIGYESDSIRNSVKESLLRFGENMKYSHSGSLSYTWPLSKIPIVDWIGLTTRYQASYDWNRAPLSQDSLGHVIQNSRKINWTAKFNMKNLYNKVPYFKKVSRGRSSRRRPSRLSRDEMGLDKMELEEKKKANKKDEEEGNKILDHGVRFLLMLKNVSFTYATTDGILLPGYGRGSNVMGFDDGFNAPGLEFIAGGWQERNIWGDQTNRNFADYALDNNWMIGRASKYITQQYLVNHTKTLNAKASFEPLKGFKIDLAADQKYTENMGENFRWNDSLWNPETNAYGMYQHQNPLRTGSFSTTVLTLATAFIPDDAEHNSPVFDKMLASRSEMSRMLGDANPNSVGMDSSGLYRYGYGGTQQDVLIGSFLSAYSGKGPSEKGNSLFSIIPMPNWRVSYNGLGKIKALKKYVRSANLRHQYSSTYTISNFTTNLKSRVDANGNLTERDLGENFITERQVMGVVIAERFSPLVGIDVTLKSDFILKGEYKQDRTLSLSLTNNQITEVSGKEFVFGTGYTFRDVKFPVQIRGKDVVSDLKIRGDLSIRSNKTVTRKIVEGRPDATAGQTSTSIKVAADYRILKKVKVRYYYDQVINTPVISRSFPTSNINTGIALQITLP